MTDSSKATGTEALLAVSIELLSRATRTDSPSNVKPEAVWPNLHLLSYGLQLNLLTHETSGLKIFDGVKRTLASLRYAECESW